MRGLLCLQYLPKVPQGLYGQGKSGGKGLFCFGQGKSGESQGSLQWSGAKLHFHSAGQGNLSFFSIKEIYATL